MRGWVAVTDGGADATGGIAELAGAGGASFIACGPEATNDISDVGGDMGGADSASGGISALPYDQITA